MSGKYLQIKILRGCYEISSIGSKVSKLIESSVIIETNEEQMISNLTKALKLPHNINILFFP